MIAAKQIIDFVSGLNTDNNFLTLKRPRQFHLEVQGSTIVCSRDGDDLRKITFSQLEDYLKTAAWLPEQDRFDPGKYPKNWQSNSYFVSILKNYLDHKDESEFRLPEECDGTALYAEGTLRTITINRYERDPDARSECLRVNGTTCVCCDRRMEEIYGTEAIHLIHVHHLKPLASIRQEYRPDPAHDLVPVCPNCHAVIHWKRKVENPRSVTEVRLLLKNSRRG